MIKVFIQIALCVAIILGICYAIDYITNTINESNNKTSTNVPAFCYKISDTSDLKVDVVQRSNNHIVQRFVSDSEEVYVIAKKVAQDNTNPDLSNRYSFRFAEEVDTICIPVLQQFSLVEKENPFYSWTITKQYENEDLGKIKTVTVFAREFIYIFYQEYATDTSLLNRLYDDFHSSRTFCFQNIRSVWLDKISTNKFMIFVSIVLNYIWIFVCFFLCLGLYEKTGGNVDNTFIKLTIICIFALIFSYLVLHDAFMDWIMSYGSFKKIPAQLLEMLFGGDDI